MGLGQRLREQRERAALTQDYVARQLGLSREVVSMWETEQRAPATNQLVVLAQLYRTDLPYLLEGRREGNKDRELLMRDLPQSKPVVEAFGQWLNFLDRYADFRRTIGAGVSGPGRPPRSLDQGGNVTDARKAPTFALEARSEFKVSYDAIHNLDTLLDEQGILVYKSYIESDATNDFVSGAFYNHPDLGYCIFVNTNQKSARVRFTLAHELAHALYHYRIGGIISRNGDKNPKEVFANTFAAHFLVPGKALREHINEIGGKNFIDHLQAVRLAYHFNVSYSMMLYRLFNEKLISFDEMKLWAEYNVKDLARKWGIRSSDNYFASEAGRDRFDGESLGIYPLSVLKFVKTSVEKDEKLLFKAANMLEVQQSVILKGLLNAEIDPSKAELQELESLLSIR